MSGIQGRNRSRTQFLLPSPAGALRAVSGERSPIREMLRALLRSDTTMELSEPELRRSIPEITSYRAIELVTELHHLKLIEMHAQPYRLGDKKLEVVLPQLLGRLSVAGRGLLADNEGFLVSSVGFPEEQATKLAALASELVDFDRRWRTSFPGSPSVSPPAWWTSAATDGSRHGLVMITIGLYPFVLYLEGDVNLVDPAIVWLVWALSHRYDREPLDLAEGS